MNKEKIKNIIIVFLLIIIIALCAVIVYKVYTNKSEEINTTIFTEDEFYKTENLVKNGYLTKVTSQSDDYIKIENNKITLKSKDVKNETKTIEISGTPKYAKSIYAGSNSGWNTVYFVLTEEGTLYYAGLEVKGSYANDETVKHTLPTEFIKVTDKKVLNIYTYNTSKENIFPYESLTIYAELENNDLVEVKGEQLNPYVTDYLVYAYKGLGETFKENHYFMDIIMTRYEYPKNDWDSAYSNYLISWDKKLYYNTENADMNNKYNSTELKYNNKSVTIEDGFTTYKDNDEDTNDYDIYVISTDKYLYQVDKDNLKLERVSDKKIINSKYINNDKKDENKGYSKYERYYEITFEDNNIQKYNIINVSTLNKA